MSAWTARVIRSDVALAAAFVTGDLIESLWRGWGRPQWLAVALPGACLLAVLAVRRRHPLAAMSVLTGSAAVGTALQSALPEATTRGDEAFVPILALMVLAFSLTAYGDRTAWLLGAPQPVLLVAVIDVAQPGSGSLRSALPFLVIGVVALPMLAGWLVRSRRELLTRLRADERALDAEQEATLHLVRAETWLAVSRRLASDLDTGLRTLASLAATGSGAGPAHLARLEETARELLTGTRRVVVELTQEDLPGPQAAPCPTGAPAARPRGDTESAVAWAAVCAACVGASVVLEARTSWADPVALVLVAALVGAVVTVSRAPVAAGMAAALVAVAFGQAVQPLDATAPLGATLLMLVMPFLVAALADRLRALVGLACWAVAIPVWVGHDDLVGAFALEVLAAVGGSVLRSHTELLSQARDTSAALAAARAERLRLAGLERRAAFAREVHDSIGHSLTVVALQAAAARKVQAAAPASADAAVAVIRTTTEAALGELHRGFDAGWDPDPLIAAARASGLRVVVRAASAPAGEAGRILHRVLQESLTNAMRHAPRSEVAIELTHGREWALVVTNTAGSETQTPYGGGVGLLGMRERVAGAGGVLTWATAVDGGFEVRAQLPDRTVEVAR